MLVEGLLAVRGIVLAQLVGAQAFGAWALFRILMGYASLVGLGGLRGLERMVAAADPDSPERRADARTLVGFSILAFGAASLAAAAVAGLAPETDMRLALAGVAACLLIDRLWYYGITYLRASGEFRRFATVELGTAALNLGLVLTLAAFWGLPGAILGLLLAHLAGLVAMAPSVPLRPALDRARLARMLGIGIPLTISTFLAMLMTSVDRLVLLAFTDLESLGHYAFAAAVGGLGAACAAVVRTLVFPEFYRRSAQLGARAGTAEHMRTTLTPFIWLMAPILTFVAVCLPLLLAVLAPGFGAVAPVAAVFLFGGVAAGLAQLLSLGVVAAGRQWLTPWLTAAGLAANLLGAILVLATGYGLLALANVSLAVRILYALGLMVLLDLGPDWRHRARLIGQAMLPLVWCSALAGLILASSPAPDPAALAVALALCTLGLLPLAPAGLRVIRAALARA